ncbi:MAG: GWxTD domain-containing protein [Deltaproteobacteria bacterium]|nr:GWxTD domain-containing protein [Deltaproteobacteria bacterium]
MKNFWIFCAAPNRRLLSVVAVLLTFLAVSASAAKGKKQKDLAPEFLIQPFVGPAYAQWLIGPIARMATRDEVEAYLRIEDDAEAAAFIEAFWEKRNPRPGEPSNRLREKFDVRAGMVDSLYGEKAYRGRHTDRGTIYILYGKPEKEDHDVAPYAGGSALIIWRYSKKSEPGLDGEKPRREFRFIREGDRTVFYSEAIRQKNLQKQRPRGHLPEATRGRNF